MRARELRHAQNAAEARLWQKLRDRRFRGLKFRPQHALGQFVADFYCAEHGLVVEVDGGVHADPDVRDHDMARDAWLTARGLRIVRIPAALVLTDINQALHHIASTLDQPSRPAPDP